MTTLRGVNGYGTNQRDSAGMVPLIWAARSGIEDAVEPFLGWRAVCPDKPDHVDIIETMILFFRLI